MMIEGTNPGSFRALSAVLSKNGYLYFRGTDNAVWRVNGTNPSDNTNFGGPNVVSARSIVFPADDGYLYFRGLDNTVWRLNLANPGDRGTPGNFRTHSGVYARDGYMYFRGTDNAVWRVNAATPSDCTNFGGPNTVSTQSSVYPADDGYAYFQGTDGTCRRVRITPPYDSAAPGNFKSRSGVFARDGYMYFRGTDNAVWRVNAANPSDCTNFGGPNTVSTMSGVFPADDGYLYFRGTDGKASRLSTIQPNDRQTPGNLTAFSDVFAADGCMHFHDAHLLVWRYSFLDGTMADYATAAAVTLQNWHDRRTGLWKTRNGPGWWNSANALYALIDYMSLTGTGRYTDVVENTFDRNSDGNFLNKYYDDEGWWALAWINACDFTKDPARKQAYLNMAKTVFADMEQGWDLSTYGGGVIWLKETRGKNSIENELFLAVAVRLYQRTSGPDREHYLQWTDLAGQWFYDTFIVADPERHLIYDGLAAVPSDTPGSDEGPDSRDWHTQTFTYTQGVILGALADMDASGLRLAGHEPLSIAGQIADAAISYLAEDGVLTEFGAGESGDSPDLPQFKGIFMRNLACLATRIGSPGNARYVDFIQRNAASVVASGRNSVNQFGYRWQGPFDEPDAARQTSALEALNAAIRVSPTAWRVSPRA
jgi:predicted alpha-1,6-mannanase (GH76 family)